MLLAMKWFLCLLLIGLGLFSYTQTQENDALKANLKQSADEIADLKMQVEIKTQQLVARNAQIAQARASTPFPAPAYIPAPTPAPKPSWMNTTSDLDRTPVPSGSARRR